MIGNNVRPVKINFPDTNVGNPLYYDGYTDSSCGEYLGLNVVRQQNS